MTSHKTLAKNGYTLLKKNINNTELMQIKKDLEVTPSKHPDYVGEDESFKLYKETDNTICVPRYYGETNFGKPTKKVGMRGTKTNMKFNGAIREEQLPIIDSCLNSIKTDGGGIVSLPCGFGKCLAKGTNVMMFDGSVKLVEDIVVGDKLMGDDSMARNVLTLATGTDHMYKIATLNGLSYTVNKSHILSLISNNTIVDISVENLMLSNINNIKGYRHIVTFDEKPVQTDPYIFGYNVNIIENIPLDYKVNSCNIRSSFIAGFLDKYGILCYNKNNYYHYFKLGIYPLIKNDIVYMCHSLGLETVITKTKIHISGDFSSIPFKLSKHKSLIYKLTNCLTYDFKLKYKGVDSYYGFEIDGNRRFLLNDFTVTHNTVLAIKMACELGLKTLVIVHKTFLQNQWRERIMQFTNARIGIIRQKKTDVKDKDIVVGMLQSIAMINYNSEIFKDFGTVIIDECFPSYTKIVTDQGSFTIAKLYELWKNNDILRIPLIKSYNEKNRQFEFKKMTYAWRKHTKELVKITLGKKKIDCTPNHKFLTTRGYKKAKNLTNNDILLGTYDNNISENVLSKNVLSKNVFSRALNEDQMQIVLGSFIGDGNISCTKSKRYRLRIVHGSDQMEYCKWKAHMFNCNTKIIQKNGYAQKNAISFATKLFDLECEFPQTKTTCPQWIIDKIDFRGIAIWIMDNKSINKKSSHINISTCSFDEDTQIRLVEKLNNLGIKSTYFKCNKGYYNITINQQSTQKLTSKIYNYIWNNKFLDYGTCRVSSVKQLIVNASNRTVYDIEIEDNHNFIVVGKESSCGSCSIIEQIGPIVHNCHHTPSRVFSQALQKIGCTYTIGLSATPFRSDGLTKILYWYLGQIIYKVERKGDKNVIVKQFNYESNDKLFVEKKQWVNGKIVPSIPRMVTNLAKIKGRNEFIIDMIVSLKDKDDRKILVLSDRLDHLELLKNGVDNILNNPELFLEEGEYTTAYYIGGMKEYQLTESSKADIIFATYAMAAEGLDIDSLNTLILATPKTNIIQSIGRIMRKPIKQGDVFPMIIDIVDQFSLFKKWGKGRIDYYNKKKYTITEYQAFDNKCVSIKDYLKIKKICDTTNITDFDIRKMYMCEKYGKSIYEDEEDCDFEEEPLTKYIYNPDYNELFTVNNLDNTDNLDNLDNSDNLDNLGNTTNIFELTKLAKLAKQKKV